MSLHSHFIYVRDRVSESFTELFQSAADTRNIASVYKRLCTELRCWGNRNKPTDMDPTNGMNAINNDLSVGLPGTCTELKLLL